MSDVVPVPARPAAPSGSEAPDARSAPASAGGTPRTTSANRLARRAIRGAWVRTVLPGACYVALSAAHLVCIATHADTAADVTQVLLMPALALAVLGTAPRPVPRLVRGALVALAFSWAGDALPRLADGDTAFLLMVGSFLLAQIAYATTFWPHRARVPRPVVPVYAAALVALAVVCRPGAGSLFGPVLVYGVALATMAVLATGLGRLGALGGAVFFCSDSLIALSRFVDGFGGTGVNIAIMATYVVGQGLIAVAALRRVAPARPEVD